MNKKTKFTLRLSLFILLIIFLNLPLLSNNTIADNLAFVSKSIKNNSHLANSLMEIDRKKGINDWVIHHFEHENFESITIDSAIEKTTLLNLIFMERKFDLIINQRSQAVYFMTIVIDNNQEFSLSNLSVAVS